MAAAEWCGAHDQFPAYLVSLNLKPLTASARDAIRAAGGSDWDKIGDVGEVLGREGPE